MKGVRIRWKAVIPAAGVLVGVLTDPNAVGAIAGALPSRAAHILLAVSAIAAIFTPAVATNRPPSQPQSPSPNAQNDLNYPYGDQ